MNKDRPQAGLECPKCGCRHFLVVYTRPKADHILRRKQCRYCGWRVLTREKIGG